MFLTGVSAYGHASVIYINQLKSLLPAAQNHYVEVSPGDRWSDLIDQAVLEILSTPTGKMFCRATDGSEEMLLKTFFVNRSSAREAMKICGPNEPFKSHRAFPKKYVLFIIPENVDFKADGWTSPRNETFLFFSEKELSTHKLVRHLIHEITVSLDQKDQIGFMDVLDWPNLGLIENNDNCEILNWLNLPLVKNTFTASRAFQIEALILKELGFPVEAGQQNFSKLSCGEKLYFLSPFLEKLQWSFSNPDSAEILVARTCRNSRQVRNSLDESTVQRLNELKLTFKNGETRNLCEYMTEAMPFKVGVSFAGGPGPRIGGGWATLENKQAVVPLKLGSTSGVEDVTTSVLKSLDSIKAEKSSNQRASGLKNTNPANPPQQPDHFLRSFDDGLKPSRTQNE